VRNCELVPCACLVVYQATTERESREETLTVAIATTALSRVGLLLLVAAASACGGSKNQGNCNPIPPPDVAVRCTQDAECTNMPPLPVSCGEAKCVAGACRFRPALTSDCPCIPGEMRSCLLPTNESGVQSCKNSGGIPTWDVCRAVCAAPDA
jgi:hypothetical protein